MDEKVLWKYIKKNTKSSYTASEDENGNLYNDICNKGLEEGQIAIRNGGEYNGFGIKAVEYIRPVLTNLRVSKAVRMLSEGNVQGAIVVLTIAEEAGKEGIGLMYSVLKKWLEINEIPVPDEYEKKAIPIKSNKIKDWIEAYSYSPVQGKFSVASIGFSKSGNPVVPESWLGRIFNDAFELHKEMDKLEWRKGKPPTSFCAIYVMDIQESKKWRAPSEMIDLNVKVGVSIFPKLSKDKKELIDLNSSIQILNSKKDYNSWLNSLPKDAKTFDVNTTDEETNEKLLLACNIDNIIESIPKYEKKRNVGLLVSTLQKLIRRGRRCSKVLYETMKELSKSPGYNLPDQQFLRVNACRQLTWRLYVSTIEDVSPYNKKNSDKYLSMNEISCLSMLANHYPDVQFIEPIIDKIILTALSVQHNDTKGSKWSFHNEETEKLDLSADARYEKIKDKNNESLLISMQMLLYGMPARGGDYDMINNAFNYINDGHYQPKQLESLSLNELLSYANEKSGLLGLMAGSDPNGYHGLLLMIQASLPFIPYNNKSTTRGLAGFLWNNASGVNVRERDEIITYPDKEDKQIFDQINFIQEDLVKKDIYIKSIKSALKDFNHYIDEPKYKKNNEIISELTSRLAFILLYGQKISISVKNKKYGIVVAGTKEAPCKVKSMSNDESEYMEGEIRDQAEKTYIEMINKKPLEIEVPVPPNGYKWIFDKRKIKLSAKYINNKITFIVDNYEIEPFDTSKILIKLSDVVTTKPHDYIEKLINQALYIKNHTKMNNDYEINLVMYALSKEKNGILYDWHQIAKKSDIPTNVWRSVYVKLFSSFDNILEVGPVDSMGNKLQNSISYMYEGTIWRVFNLLSVIYRGTVINKSSIKGAKFQINTTTPEYIDLINKVKSLMARPLLKPNVKLQKTQIVSKLWEHQQKTANHIVHAITVLGRSGVGDASATGAGKTLTALAVISALYNYNLSRNDLAYRGFLILLPTSFLFETWINEIQKHAKGFHIVIQNANGSLTDYEDNKTIKESDIMQNTILITTLGRTREHPFEIPFIFVVIDECLSVQNKNALQTAEAFKQIVSSQYKALLMSASWFRSRFDGLILMLKMLGTNLPENKQYLDAILSESIVSNIPITNRKWVTVNNPFKMSKELREKYDTILGQDINSERLYSKLLSFLLDNFDYMGSFRKIIKAREKEGHRCLIFGRSVTEANEMSKELENVTRFPDISGKHVVTTFHEAGKGINNLVMLDVIVTRITDIDRIMQAKGRLDRYGQKANTLYVDYVYVDESVDSAHLLRLQIANDFYNTYILPLGEYFYDLAVGKKSPQKNKNKLN